jgi:hypothetical protein
MLRLEVNTSGESSGSDEGKLEMLVTVFAPGDQRGAYQAATGASRTPATGGRSESGPAAASEKEHPLHALYLTAPACLPKTPGRYLPTGTILTGISVFSSV